jgi:glycosyltransferase involved in cell wall biosynthesis
MHILFLASWYKITKHDMTGTFFEEQARMFQNKGHQVGVLACSYKYKFLQNYRERRFYEIKNWNDNGIETYYSSSHSITPKKKHPSKWDIKLYLFRGYNIYIKYVKKNGKPDVLHAQSSIWGGILAKYISKRENIPYFLTEHFSELILNEKYSNETLPYKKIIESVFNNSIHSFAVSSFFKSEILKHYAVETKKLIVLPNLLSSNLIKNIDIESNFSDKENIILNIGNLIELKNQITILKTIQDINKNGSNVKLRIIGEGKLKSDIIKYIKDNNLEDSVKLLGHKTRNEVFEELIQSSLLVSASTFETFGMSLIESLAFGRPVVALDSGGPRDIITEKDGILLQENTPEAFAKAIETVINNYYQYDQADISKRCIERFGENKIYQELMRYYQQVLS